MELEVIFFILAAVTVLLNIICVTFYIRNMNAIRRAGLESTVTFRTAKTNRTASTPNAAQGASIKISDPATATVLTATELAPQEDDRTETMLD